MDNSNVSDNVLVDLHSTTGSVNGDLTEGRKLSGNVTVSARTSTDSVDLSLAIDYYVGERIESHTDSVEIRADGRRFSGNEAPL